jgi:uncharacterized ferritin-like protein (DUF455 family)
VSQESRSTVKQCGVSKLAKLANRATEVNMENISNASRATGDSLLAALARAALAADRPEAKLAVMGQLREQIAVPPTPTFAIERTLSLKRGRFAPLAVVQPEALGRRNPGTTTGRAALLHAIAHIEYVAIDLALDHALRFEALPGEYYSDWLQVACEEAGHFELLAARLAVLDCRYGDYPVHEGLWEMATKTQHDVLARMALVPRLLEARGLDATPPIQRKLEAAGDHESARVLDVILRDEIGHVGLGDRWFRYLCAERGADVETTYRDLIAEHDAPWPQSPMNREARLAAGFAPAELDCLTAGRRSR